MNNIVDSNQHPTIPQDRNVVVGHMKQVGTAAGERNFELLAYRVNRRVHDSDLLAKRCNAVAVTISDDDPNGRRLAALAKLLDQIEYVSAQACAQPASINRDLLRFRHNLQS